MLLHTHPEVAELLLGEEAETLRAIEAHVGRTLAVRGDPRYHREQFELSAG